MSEFNNYLKDIKNNNEITNFQKIHAFSQLCKKYNIEPIILRLSGDIKNKIKRTSYLITFTTTRVIILKKGNIKSLFDIGYIAGLGPYLYYLVSDKVNLEDVKLKNSLIQNVTLNSSSANGYSIEYNSIKKIVFCNGVETRVTNMLGSAVSDNFLKICTKEEKLYNFMIPVKKNGDYEKIFYWLRMSLPISIDKE